MHAPRRLLFADSATFPKCFPIFHRFHQLLPLAQHQRARRSVSHELPEWDIFQWGVCKCVRAALSSRSPRENRASTSPPPPCVPLFRIPPPPRSSSPPISLRLRSALIRPCSHAGEMTEGGREGGRKRRHSREGGEKEMTGLQQVWRIGSEGEVGGSAPLMMSLSPWGRRRLASPHENTFYAQKLFLFALL